MMGLLTITIKSIKAKLNELEPIQFGNVRDKTLTANTLDRINTELSDLVEFIDDGLRDVPRCSHGSHHPHIEGGTTGFHYDHPTSCGEWEAKGGMFVYPWRLKEQNNDTGL